MKILKRIFYFSAAFILATGAVLAIFHQMGLFEVDSIPIEIALEDQMTILPGDRSSAAALATSTAQGDARPGPTGLKNRLEKRVAKFADKRIWEIDLKELRASIIRDEWVKDVLISRSFPNEIKIRVSSKKPVLLLVDAKGSLLPITEDGALLNALPADVVPDVPLLRGEAFMQGIARRKNAVAVALDLPERGPLSRRNIAEIAWTKEDGYTFTLMQPKIDVRLGEDRLSIKVLRVSQVLNYMSSNQLKGREIDASFSKKVLVRLRKGP